MILQSLYNLSGDAVGYQIRDRLSFMRFTGITMAGRVPDAKTIWLFREKLIEAELIETLFGAMKIRAEDLILRTAGIVRARCKIGLRNLTCNMTRFGKPEAVKG